MSNAGWDRYGMDLARVVAGRSKDPSTQCGAVLLDARRRVVSTGYNGFPRGIPDEAMLLQDRETKLALTLHAEENALLFAHRDLHGCTLYVWPMPPCAACARKLVQAGIVRVVALAPTPEQAQRWGSSMEWARWLYTMAGIEYLELGRGP